ncbi:MAG: SpoIIE family protein phosphatase, partial [Bacteroidota bacterium]
EYAYMLENFDKEWNYVGNRMTASYTNLDHGEYTFRVRAANSDGIWNKDGVSVKIIITPPFWKTWWFRILAILVIVVAAYSFYQARISQIKRQKQKLERQVKERTAEIMKQKEEILMKNETLMQQKEEIEAQRDFVMMQGDKIARQRHKIQQQRDFVTKQKEEVEASIQYAKKIQHALLPPEEYLHNSLPEHFILFRPRDIVSGDFYWATEKEGKLVIVASDCTGHGVPGAFMSMLGVAFLNEIVNKMENIHAGIILDNLRDIVIHSLHQTGKFGESQDGMDIALCVLDLSSRRLEYAGAYNPLYMIRDGELIEFKADKMPIGYYHAAGDKLFTTNEIELQEKDRLYIFSDGFADQFGGPNGKKYKYSRFKELLLEIHEKPMIEQRQILDKTFIDWKNKHDQIDDVVVVGVRV